MEKKKNLSSTQKALIIPLGILLCIVAGFLFFKSYQQEKQDIQQEEVVLEEKQKFQPQETKKEAAVPSGEETKIDSIDSVEEPEETNRDSVENEIEELSVLDEPKQLTDINISRIRSLFGNADLKEENMPTGKIYYQGHNGKLESSVLHNNGVFTEQLKSYDHKGNKVDELEIGIIDETAKPVKHAVISKNKISVFEIVTTKGGKKEKPVEKVTEYTITPHMNFREGKTYTRLM